MFDIPVPGEVRNMNQAVNAVADSDKNAEFGNAPDLSFHLGSDRKLFLDNFPRIGFDLLHPEGYFSPFPCSIPRRPQCLRAPPAWKDGGFHGTRSFPKYGPAPRCRAPVPQKRRNRSGWRLFP